MDPLKYYHVLELDPRASLEEARQAYRDLIAVWHPDRYAHNPRLQAKAEEKLKTLNAAFEIVSRHIAKSGTSAGSSPGKTSVSSTGASEPKSEGHNADDRAAAWARTESRLAALARAKELAEARKSAQAREDKRRAEEEEKRQAQALQDRRQAEIQRRALAREAAAKIRREKVEARERAWAETEKKLQALKRAREKAARTDQASPDDQPTPVSRWWYLRQILIGGGILLLVLSGNAIQTYIHISFKAKLIMIGSGFLLWLVIANIASRKGRKKKGN